MKELGFSEVSADRLCESGALHKGALRIGGCVIGGALALFTIVFLMPHMDTFAATWPTQQTQARAQAIRSQTER